MKDDYFQKQYDIPEACVSVLQGPDKSPASFLTVWVQKDEKCLMTFSKLVCFSITHRKNSKCHPLLNYQVVCISTNFLAAEADCCYFYRRINSLGLSMRRVSWWNIVCIRIKLEKEICSPIGSWECVGENVSSGAPSRLMACHHTTPYDHISCTFIDYKVYRGIGRN